MFLHLYLTCINNTGQWDVILFNGFMFKITYVFLENLVRETTGLK